jgi:site-specific recombinase XerD
MQMENQQTRLTIVEQACEKVPGFTLLYSQFKQKMSISGRSSSTFINYSRHLAGIALHYERLPTMLSNNEIDDYLYHLQQQFKSPSDTYFKHTVFSLRFVFRMHGLTEMRIRLPKIKRIKKLPVVLSKPEMVSMLNKPRLLKHRVLIALLYGCGLRCFEVRNIKLNDIDFDRSMLHVKQGKGKKDRYLPLGMMLSAILKNYIELNKPKIWLFNGKHKNKIWCEFSTKYSQKGVQWVIKSAAKTAGIKKDINVHTLRHTFATHMLEDGLDIISIKELLGHSRIETTLTYLHIAQISRKDKFSPLDNLNGVRVSQGIQCKIDFCYE